MSAESCERGSKSIMELTVIKISRHTWVSTSLFMVSMPTMIPVLSLPTQLYSISTRKHQLLIISMVRVSMVGMYFLICTV